MRVNLKIQILTSLFKRVECISVICFFLFLVTSCDKDPSESHVDTLSYPSVIPVVMTSAVTEITQTSAVTGGIIEERGIDRIIERGVCWSTSPSPTIENSRTKEGLTGNSFESEITDLIPETTYYVRAYARNSMGTGYGNELSFTANLALYSCFIGKCELSSNGEFGSLNECQENCDKESACGDLPPNTICNPITGRVWMDRNLGASTVALSVDDEQAYGFLYQWGRDTDGHQIRSSGETSTPSSSFNPGHDDFILVPGNNGSGDWLYPGNNDLWQGLNGINNPCPNGFRLPTKAEWEDEISSWNSTDISGAFSSNLKLTATGFRARDDGDILYAGSRCYYWSSGEVYMQGFYRSWVLKIGQSNGANFDVFDRANGCCVRCIQD